MGRTATARTATAVAPRRHRSDHPRERHRAVGERLDDRLPDAPQQLLAAGVAGEVEAQAHRVDEEAHQPLHLRTPVGQRRAHQQVLAAAPARQHGGPGGEQDGEPRRPYRAASRRRGGEAVGGGDGGGRHEERPRAAGQRRRRRPRPVQGQLRQRGVAGPGQPPPPVLQLALLVRRRLALGLPFPGGEVGETQRRLRGQRPEGRLRRSPCSRGRGEVLPVERRQVAEQQALRPTVEDQVVDGEEQPAARRPAVGTGGRGQAQQARPQQRRLVESEGAPRLGAGQPPCLGVAAPPRQGTEVDHRQPRPRRRLLLPRSVRRVEEADRQGAMAGRDAGQRGGQGRGVHRAPQVDGAGDVEQRRAGGQPLLEPQPLLRPRQRHRLAGGTPRDVLAARPGAVLLSFPRTPQARGERRPQLRSRLHRAALGLAHRRLTSSTAPLRHGPGGQRLGCSPSARPARRGSALGARPRLPWDLLLAGITSSPPLSRRLGVVAQHVQHGSQPVASQRLELGTQGLLHPQPRLDYRVPLRGGAGTVRWRLIGRAGAAPWTTRQGYRQDLTARCSPRPTAAAANPPGRPCDARSRPGTPRSARRPGSRPGTVGAPA